MASSAAHPSINLAAARPAALLARRAWLPTTTPSRRSLRCRAADGEGQQQQSNAAEAAPPAAGSGGAGGSSQEQLKRPAVEDPSVAKGQRTAIITGAISIIFGVIYLALVSFLDMRGGELLPPPPEAYLP
ncbi:hypothetical protein COHA_010506 [Chlorella ohadii]|uniref:Uncharacterized protein n=1 Tax=Chlorella ohadii TaxID=2649997 RepID=A0AAD5DG70_9CHLO|nr:hypothetical protein COHA_010506 [Chlorella ohadii]